MSTTVPETEAAEALAAASPRALLTSYAALTHRLGYAQSERDGETMRTLRTERGLIEDEILSRMGDPR